MSLQNTLSKIDTEIDQGNLGKARDRLQGLITSFPDDLSLRAKLAEIYWKLQEPVMAGRYWFLLEPETETMLIAIKEFEKRHGNDPLQILHNNKFRGDYNLTKDTFAGQKLLELEQQANKKYPEFKGIRKEVSGEINNNSNSNRYLTFISLIMLLLIIAIWIIGAGTVLYWLCNKLF